MTRHTGSWPRSAASGRTRSGAVRRGGASSRRRARTSSSARTWSTRATRGPSTAQNQGIALPWRSADGALARHRRRLGRAAGALGERARPARRLAAGRRACDGPAGNADCQPGTVARHDRASCARRSSSPTNLRPAAGPASGSAVTSATWQGTETFAFAATDEGGGVYQAILEVDGAPVLARTIDDCGRALRRHDGGRPRVHAPAAVPDGGRRARGDRRRRAAGGRSRRRAARLRRRRQPAHRLRGAQDDRRAGGAGRAGQPLAERGAANGDNAADAARAGRALGADRARDPDRALRRAQRDPRAPDRCRRRRACATRASSCASAIDGRAAARRSTRAARGRAATGASRSSCRATRRRGRCCCATAATPTTPSPPRRRRLRCKVRVGIAAVGRAARGHEGPQRQAQRPAGRPAAAARAASSSSCRRAAPREPWITVRTIRAWRSGRFATRYTLPPRRAASTRCGCASGRPDDYPLRHRHLSRRPRARASEPAPLPFRPHEPGPRHRRRRHDRRGGRAPPAARPRLRGARVRPAPGAGLDARGLRGAHRRPAACSTRRARRRRAART